MDVSFPGTKRPHSECSFARTNVWTFRSRNETAYSSSNIRALERLSKPNEEKNVTVCNKFKMIFADTIRDAILTCGRKLT